ncbi:MAG: hypothetical protein EXS39_02150 [Opitutaceae bacterium]|nr:hypothetical protein [Opitutaceae bacterium]
MNQPTHVGKLAALGLKDAEDVLQPRELAPGTGSRIMDQSSAPHWSASAWMASIHLQEPKRT